MFETPIALLLAADRRHQQRLAALEKARAAKANPKPKPTVPRRLPFALYYEE